MNMNYTKFENNMYIIMIKKIDLRDKDSGKAYCRNRRSTEVGKHRWPLSRVGKCVRENETITMNIIFKV